MQDRTDKFNQEFLSQNKSKNNQSFSIKRIVFFLGIMLVSLAIGLLVLTESANQAIVKNQMLDTIEAASSQKPILISHRGYLNKEPEFSFKGYDLAIENGSSFIEQDVILSADGIAYVSHDDDLSRTFNQDIKISETNSSVLDEIRYPNLNENLHRLTDVLERYQGKTNFVIEAKHLENEVLGELETEICKDIKKYELENNVIFQDSQFPDTDYFHLGLPNVPILFLYLEDDIPTKQSINNLPDYVKIIGVNLETDFVPEVKKVANQRGIKYCGYTIENNNQNPEIIDQKLELFFTNDTKGSLDYLKNHRLKNKD